MVSNREVSLSSLWFNQRISSRLLTSRFVTGMPQVTSFDRFAKLFSVTLSWLLEKVRHRWCDFSQVSSRAEEATAQLLRPKPQFWLAKCHLPSIFCHLKFPCCIFIALQVNPPWALFPSSRFNLFLLRLFSTDLCINPVIPCWHTKCQHIKLKCWSHHFPVAFWNDNKRHLSFATLSTCAISKKPGKLLFFPA